MIQKLLKVYVREATERAMMNEEKIARFNDWERKRSHCDRVQVDSFERGPKSAYSRKEKYQPNYMQEED